MFQKKGEKRKMRNKTLTLSDKQNKPKFSVKI